MATSGGFNTTNITYDGLTFRMRFSWERTSYSVSGNYSVISWTLTGVRVAGGTSGYFMYSGPFSATVSGSTKTNSSRIKMYGGTLVLSGTRTIYHNSEGKGSFSASAKGALYTSSYNSSGSGSWNLPDIARATTPEINSVTEIEKTYAISTPGASSTFAHTLQTIINGTTTTIATNVATSYNWTLPDELYTELGVSETIPAKLRCITYNGATNVGYKDVNFTIKKQPASRITAPENLYIEEISVLNLINQFETFTNNVYIETLTEKIEIAIDSTGGEINWTIPPVFYDLAGLESSIAANFVVETYSGHTFIGRYILPCIVKKRPYDITVEYNVGGYLSAPAVGRYKDIINVEKEVFSNYQIQSLKITQAGTTKDIVNFQFVMGKGDAKIVGIFTEKEVPEYRKKISKPILFEGSATEFDSYGLGILADTIKSHVTEEINGIFELEVEYPAIGKFATKLIEGNILLAKPNEKEAPQPFRIYKATKPISGIITVYAEHLSYDLSYKPIGPIDINDSAELIDLLNSKAEPFYFTSEIYNTNNITTEKPSSLRAVMGEKGILEAYGGEWKYNGYESKLMVRRGEETSVEISYGKNLLDAKQTEDITNVTTAIFPYYSKGESYVEGSVVDSQYVNLYPIKKIGFFDITDYFEPEEGQEEIIPTPEQVTAKAAEIVDEIVSPLKTENLVIDFVQLWQTEEFKHVGQFSQVELGDTITVNVEKYGIMTRNRIIKTIYDTLLDRFTKIEIGEAAASVESKLLDNASALNAEINQEFPNGIEVKGGIITDSLTSQTADFANMPTISGAPIIESGSNVDGSWTKWADGTMICYLPLKYIATATMISYDIGGYRSYELTFPQSFVGGNIAFNSDGYISSYGDAGSWNNGKWIDNSTCSVSLLVYNYSTASRAHYVGYTAIGRWK